MRITNSMLIGNFMRNMTSNMKRMDTLQMQMATGRKFNRPSQDPVGMTRSMQIRKDLSRLEQYTKNVEDAQAWLNQTETALNEIKDIIHRVNVLTLQGINGSNSQDDRQKIADELDQLKEQLVQAGNSTYAGRYIFGGYNTTQAPFEIPEPGKILYNNKDLADAALMAGESAEVIDYEVGKGVTLGISTPGCNVFGIGPDNLYSVIDEISNNLRNNVDPSDDLQPYITKLQDKLGRILSEISEVGGKTNRLDLIKKRLENDYYNYETLRSQVEGVDQEQVIIDFKMAEVVYRSSLAVGARIIQPSLMDFLR